MFISVEKGIRREKRLFKTAWCKRLKKTARAGGYSLKKMSIM